MGGTEEDHVKLKSVYLMRGLDSNRGSSLPQPPCPRPRPDPTTSQRVYCLSKHSVFLDQGMKHKTQAVHTSSKEIAIIYGQGYRRQRDGRHRDGRHRAQILAEAKNLVLPQDVQTDARALYNRQRRLFPHE